MLVESMPAQDKLTEDMPAHVELVVDKTALNTLVDSRPPQGKLVLGKPAQGGLVADMPAQSRLGLLQREKFTAELFHGEQHKMEQPMGKPPWGSGKEQGCPSKSGTGWTCSRQKPERSCGLEWTHLGGVYQTVRGLI
jgi:hypothetical protein